MASAQEESATVTPVIQEMTARRLFAHPRSFTTQQTTLVDWLVPPVRTRTSTQKPAYLVLALATSV